ncbi:MAG: RNase adapter RapZ [Rhodobacteraceae bacterium]|nr:RNase adapter RapZ [Paracoccaceae bacterium]
MAEPFDDHGNRVVLVTGPSGAGRSTAINVLEDLGFEAIDNLPLSLLPRVLDGPPLGHPLALGLDVRNRDFSVNAIFDLTQDPCIGAELLYLDCHPEILRRRFSETRRRHPLAPTGGPETGIELEIDLLGPLRSRATLLIDTSELTPHELRAELQRWFDPDPGSRMSVLVQSFSYKRGLPRGVDLAFDCRCLRNPHWDPDLRPLDGRDLRVQSHVEADPRSPEFFRLIADLAELMLPAYRDEGKTHLTIGFGCTGGQHRSVALTEKLAKVLAKAGWQVSKRHRELERRARSAPPQALG